MATSIFVADNADQLAVVAHQMLLQILAGRLSQQGNASMALSGGSTPKKLFELFAADPPGTVDWSKVHLFWGDERNVPWQHPDSNFLMTKQAWLDPADYPQDRIHPVPIDVDQPAQTAIAYEQTLRQILSTPANAFPELDIILLGLGDDAHTASLFPGTAGLSETSRSVIANYVEKLSTWRITLTAPAINAAKHILFLVAGEKKTEALRQIWHGPRDPHLYPAQLIEPTQGDLVWLVDRAALADLSVPDHWAVHEM